MYTEAIFQMIKQASTQLPQDVIEALIEAKNREAQNSTAELSLQTILTNIQQAQSLSSPICQDTGFPNFFIRTPEGFIQKELKASIKKAVQKATQEGFLRPNSVDSLSGENSGDNTGEDFPKLYFEEDEQLTNTIKIKLLLKGGGSENVSDQIALPATLADFGKAGRNLEGVKKAILQVVKNAQGKGCAPGILSVHIGSDRAGGYYHAKKGLLKEIGNNFSAPQELQSLSAEILEEANAMNIGPMGLGGKTTLLDCKISASHRLPASYFVSVAYMCWASRKASCEIQIDSTKFSVKQNISHKNIFQSPPDKGDLGGLNKDPKQSLKTLNFPLSEKDTRELQVGDVVLLNGTIYTGRDTLHVFSQDNDLCKDISGSAIYHCGPVAVQENGKWIFKAAGPTTSIREEPYQADFIKKTGIRAVIGKGGMGAQTLKGLQENGAVYLHAIGGAATYYAQSVKEVSDVSYLEFGIPEAMWEIKIKDFLAVVSMDSEGNSLHE